MSDFRFTMPDMKGLAANLSRLKASLQHVVPKSISVQMPSLPASQTDPLMALPLFNEWYRGGGPSRSGMSIDEFCDLDEQVAKLRRELSVVDNALLDAGKAWDSLMSASVEGAARAASERLVGVLGSLLAHLESLMTQASATGVQTQSTDALVEVKLDREAAECAAAETALAQARRDYDAAALEYRNAIEELKGFSAFKNGFLTGITLYIHNPVKTNRDRARKAVASANEALARQQDLLAQSKQCRTELAELRGALARLAGLKTAVSQIQNAANASHLQAAEAQTWLQRSRKVSAGAIATRFRENAETALSELFAWHEPLAQAA
jgi:hypothetical protein